MDLNPNPSLNIPNQIDTGELLFVLVGGVTTMSCISLVLFQA